MARRLAASRGFLLALALACALQCIYAQTGTDNPETLPGPGTDPASMTDPVDNTQKNTTETTTTEQTIVNEDGSVQTVVSTTTTVTTSTGDGDTTTETTTETTVITVESSTTIQNVFIPVYNSTVEAADCSRGINICFAIDSSGSITTEDFANEIQVAKQLARSAAEESAGSSQLMAAQFGDVVQNLTSAPITQYAEFEAVLDGASNGGVEENSAMGDGLLACTQQLLGIDNDLPSFLLLLTDGRPNLAPEGLDPAAWPFVVADAAKRRDMYVMSVLSKPTPETEPAALNSTLLQLMASSNSAGPLYFQVNTSSELPNLVAPLSEAVCSDTGYELLQGQHVTLDPEQLQYISQVLNETATLESTEVFANGTFQQQILEEFVVLVEDVAETQEDPTAGTGAICGQKPMCRMFLEDVLCCRDNTIITSRVSTYVTILCTDPVKPIGAKAPMGNDNPICMSVDGPDNVTVSSVFNGLQSCNGATYFRYLINWLDSQYRVENTYFNGTRWNGTMYIDATALEPGMPGTCGYELVQPCGYEGKAYYSITDIEPLQLVVNNDPSKPYGGVRNEFDLNALDGLTFLDTTAPGTCRSMLSVWLPSDFYVPGGWEDYNEGFRYDCNANDLGGNPGDLFEEDTVENSDLAG